MEVNSAPGPVILYPSTGSGTAWNKALVLGSLSSPAPGRILNKGYLVLGGFVETRTNRIAHRLGLGPDSVATKIRTSFGTGTQRSSNLAALRHQIPPGLEKSCSRLMKYTLPQEAFSTQRRAFQNIVTLITLFPGLRLLFLRSKYIQCRNQTKDRISALWARSDNSPDEEWEFWRSLTATSLSDMNISAILEECSILQLTQCGPSLGVIERLLIAHDCEVRRRDVSRRDLFPIYCGALCIRYLGGILALPGFWIEMGSTIYQEVTRKICSTMVGVLQDLRVDIDQLEDTTEPEAPSDYEGVDLLADTILTGISDWLRNMDAAKWRHQLWYGKFLDVVGLLRRPRSADLLPNSFAHATSEAFSSLMLLVPTDDNEKFDIIHIRNLNSQEDQTMGEPDTLYPEPRINSDTTLFPGNVGNETEVASAQESLHVPSPLVNPLNPTSSSETPHSSIRLEASSSHTGMDVKQNKKEAERMQRELEKQRRVVVEKRWREQATAVMQKRRQIGREELEWWAA
ncbi:hypothetical protein B0H13DRAFT_2466782 [Mycena leptocephala]|nr:hypothetical protein B0H13DRAFT_2466782 [Mycena leptocephala]